MLTTSCDLNSRAPQPTATGNFWPKPQRRRSRNCVGHQSPGLWTHPRDRADRYDTLDYWVELAKLLERGKFDALFLADVLGVYDVFRGSPDGAIANAVQVPVNDPLLLIPAMAYVTRNLGFGVTCAVSYEHP